MIKMKFLKLLNKQSYKMYMTKTKKKKEKMKNFY